MAAKAFDQVGAAGDDSGLWPSEQLVAREADEVRPCGQCDSGSGLTLHVDERARAEIVHERQLVAARHSSELLESRLLGEPDDAEIRLVHTQQQRSVRPDRPLVVGCSGPVSRPDLDQAGARASEHVRNSEPIADLDQLTPRDDDLATLGESGEREQHRSRVVVDHDRRLGSGQPPQQRRKVILARAARARREVVLQVRVAGRLAYALERGLGERRPAEVRMQEDPGGVDDAPECGAPRRRERLCQPLLQIPGVRPGPDLLTGVVEHRPRLGTASGSSTSRTSSSTDGRSRSCTKMSVEPPERLLCKS